MMAEHLGFLKIESYKRGVIFSSAFNFAAKLLAFFQSIAIAYYFGAQSKTDIYFYSLATVLIISAFVSNLDYSVLIPESMRLTVQRGKEESMRFLNFFIYAYLAAGLFITIVCYLNPVGIFTLISKFDKNVLQGNVAILLLAIPLFTMITMTNFFVDILISYKFFTMPMIASMLNSILVLAFIFLFHNGMGVESALTGLLIGYLINMLLLIYLMKKQIGWSFKFRFMDIGRKNWNNIIFTQFGSLLSAFANYVPIFLLSGFSPGVITALNYGQKSADVFNQLISGQFSSVVGVRFNELYAEKNFKKLNEVFQDSVNLLVFILMPLSALFFIYGDEVMRIIFQRGAFRTSSLNIISEFFKYFSLLLPLLASCTIVTRIFMAGQKIIEKFWFTMILNLAQGVIVFFCIKYLSYLGYPIALIIVHGVNTIAGYILVKMFFPMIEIRKVVNSFIVTGIMNMAIFFAVWKLKGMLGGPGAIFNVMAGCLAYFTILLAANLIFKVNTLVNKYVYIALGMLKNILQFRKAGI